MGRKLTHEEYVTRVAKLNPNIEVIELYDGYENKIKHKCKIDGYEWYSTPDNILQGHGCSKCKIRNHIQNTSKTHEQYILEVSRINPSVEVVGRYVNIETKILHKCNICGHEWLATPNVILNGRKCPVCTHKCIGNPPEYRNSIWASEYREYFSKYITEEQMKIYMPYSKKKINVICPECGISKNISLNTLLNYGLGCICGDGYSYPNKFIRNFLKQLNINYKPEYKSDWTCGKIYDIYIPELKCIIENHGLQHYSKGFLNLGGRSVEEERSNDIYKKQLALKNDIIHYIELDCRYSNVEWIKNSIMNSVLPTLLNFDEDNIDWNLCDEYAVKNLVKDASILWNQNYTMKQIENILNISHNTLALYLRKGNNIGWCVYTSNDGIKRSMREYSGSNHHSARKVIRLIDLNIYETLTQAAKDNDVHKTTMFEKIKDKKGFMYYDDWIKQNEFFKKDSENFTKTS